MSDMVTAAGIPEVAIGTGTYESNKAPAEFSGKWSDMASDMANIAKELGVSEQPAQPVAQPPQAVVTQPAPTAPVSPQAETKAAPAAVPAQAAPAPEVPEKFRGADGKLDQGKLLNSYLEAEKALKKAQNAKSVPVEVAPAPQLVQQPQPVQTGGLTPLEFQVARDIYAGGGVSEANAIAQARVQIRLAEAARMSAAQEAQQSISPFMERVSDSQRRSELQELAKSHPEVLTPQGHAELVKIREENPWINASPEPWKAATLILLGQKGLNGQAGTVAIPTPTGAQQTVNPLPVTPSQPAANPLQLNTPAQIEAYVKTLNPEQEAEFWKKAGMKWDVPKSAFIGF